METSEGQSTTLPLCIFFPILKIKEVLFLSSDTPQPHIKGHIKQKKGVKFLVVFVVSLRRRIRDFTKSNTSFLDTFLILYCQMMWRSQLVPRGYNFLSLVFFQFQNLIAYRTQGGGREERAAEKWGGKKEKRKSRKRNLTLFKYLLKKSMTPQKILQVSYSEVSNYHHYHHYSSSS